MTGFYVLLWCLCGLACGFIHQRHPETELRTGAAVFWMTLWPVLILFVYASLWHDKRIAARSKAANDYLGLVHTSIANEVKRRDFTDS